MKKKANSKKKFSWRLLCYFMIYEVLIIVITIPFLVYYGPFERVKKSTVDRAMSTFSHQYLATLFLSQEKIDAIRKQNLDYDSDNVPSSNGKEVKIEHRRNNQIERFEVNETRYQGYILEISDPTRIKVGVTAMLGKRGQTTSEMAKAHDAAAAINGGGFTDSVVGGKQWVGTGAFPAGIVITDGKVIDTNVPKMEKRTVTAFKDGKLIVGEYSISELLKMGVTEALSFDKILIKDGKPKIQGDGGKGIDPRTAVGQKADGTIVFIVIDGRSGFKQGATLREVQNILLQNGVVNASELDGGSSSTMYYDGEVINKPSDKEGERTIATILYAK